MVALVMPLAALEVTQLQAPCTRPTIRGAGREAGSHKRLAGAGALY